MILSHFLLIYWIIHAARAICPYAIREVRDKEWYLETKSELSHKYGWIKFAVS